MKKKNFGTFAMRPDTFLLAWSLIMAQSAHAADPLTEQAAFDQYFRQPSPSPHSSWRGHFSLGVVAGFNINARFNETGLFKLAPSTQTGGVYDDGYVLNDKTGNSGYTTDWSYQNASQYNPSSQTLVFHRTQDFQLGASPSSADGGPFPGFELDYGGTIHEWDSFQLGWDFGFALVPVDIVDHTTQSVVANQTAYVYNTGGIVLPGPGYQGSFNGPGPLLPTSATPSSSISTGTISGSRTLQTILYTFRLGPTLSWDLSKNWSLALGAGPALGLASSEYQYNEIITTAGSSAPSKGSFQSMNVVYGGDLNSTLYFHTSDEARAVDLYLGIQYMPLSSSVFSQGGREARLNLSGQVYLSAGINWPF